MVAWCRTWARSEAGEDLCIAQELRSRVPPRSPSAELPTVGRPGFARAPAPLDASVVRTPATAPPRRRATPQSAARRGQGPPPPRGPRHSAPRGARRLIQRQEDRRRPAEAGEELAATRPRPPGVLAGLTVCEPLCSTEPRGGGEREELTVGDRREIDRQPLLDLGQGLAAEALHEAREETTRSVPRPGKAVSAAGDAGLGMLLLASPVPWLLPSVPSPLRVAPPLPASEGLRSLPAPPRAGPHRVRARPAKRLAPPYRLTFSPAPSTRRSGR